MPPLVLVLMSTTLAGTPATRPASRPENLLLLPDAAGRWRPITSREQWPLRTAGTLRGMQQVMGPLLDIESNEDGVTRQVAPTDQRPAPDLRDVESVHETGYTRRKLYLRVETRDEVPAYLLIPDDLPRDRRVPAMLALHQTTRIGKGEPAGLGGKPNLRYGQELARRGYIVLVPDYPSFGDYSYDFKKSRFASGTMKAIYNNIRCVDYLCTLPQVDSRRIGVIGHSLGGHNALFTAAFDARLRVVITSCGWNPFRYYEGGDLASWASDRYIPRILTSYRRAEDLPFEFEDILAAIAPRAIFSCSPTRDDNFDVVGVRAAEKLLKPVYEFLQVPDRLVIRYPECEHDFPPDTRRESYEFLDRMLKGVTDR